MLYIGTSGWAYPEWRAEAGRQGKKGRPGFYPAGMGPSRFLQHYASVLNACEINRTFYGLCSETAVSTWARTTPEGFRFTAKAHRRLTHTIRISERARRDFIGEFTATLQPLGPRLAGLLWQFPPTRERDDDLLGSLLGALPAGVTSAFEFRHETWDAPEVDEALAAAGAVRCLSEEEGKVPASLPGGDLGYVRLRADRYGRRERTAWLDLLRSEAAHRDVFAFTKHRDVAPDDPFGGVGLARWLREQVA